MVDPDFLRARLKQLGGPGAALLDHTADGDGARYRLRHGLDAKDMPSVVRRVMPGDITIERSERWAREDGVYRGEVQVAIPGTPASAAGGMRLRDLPDGGSELDVRVDVTVSVPLIGGKIEKLIASQFEAGTAKEHAVGVAWLTGAR